MNIKPLSYLLLLMDSLGLDINLENFNRLWKLFAPNICFEEETLETLVNLCQTLKRPERQLETKASGAASTMQKSRQEVQSPTQIRQTVNPVIASQENFQEEDLITKSSLIQSTLTGRYVYGIVLSTESLPTPFKISGIDQQSVRVIWYTNIGALVHDCQPEAYQSPDREVVSVWLRQHQDVLDWAVNRYSSVIPMSFDVIIKGTSDTGTDQIVTHWLHTNYQTLKEQLTYLAEKTEFGIKIFCATETLTKKAEATNPAIQKLKSRMSAMSQGMAYLYRAELGSMIREAQLAVREDLTQTLCQRLKQVGCAIKLQNTGPKVKPDGETEILNLAILVHSTQTETVGAILEEYQEQMEVRIHFTGPWPTYSFVENMEFANDVAGS